MVISIKRAGPCQVFVSNVVGCESTRLEGLRVAAYLAANGHTVVSSSREADWVVMNTCAFTGPHREDLEERLRSLMESAPEARVVIIGCVREIAPALIEPYETVLVCGHEDLERLDALFYRSVRFEDTPVHQWSSGVKRVVVPVGRGCVSRCNYCSIKKTVGAMKSRPVGEIVADIRRGLSEGNDRFLLAADDLGSYGRDIGSGLAELLGAVDALEEEFRVLLDNLHPKFFLECYGAVESFLASRHASRWLFLPVQSAAREVLASMNRDYPMGEICERLDDLRRAVPSIRFYYDIMVGYPTETEEAFDETVSFITKYPPSCLTISRFSPEEGTPAAALDPVDPEVVRQRHWWLKGMYDMAVTRSGTEVRSWGEG